MDEDTKTLIGQLCVRAGMIMEDHAPNLIIALPDDRAMLEDQLIRTGQAGRDIASLLEASRVLLRNLDDLR